MSYHEIRGVSEGEYWLAHERVLEGHRKAIINLGPFFGMPWNTPSVDIVLRPMLLSERTDVKTPRIYIHADAASIGWGASISKYRNWKANSWHGVAHGTAHYLDLKSGKVEERKRTLGIEDPSFSGALSEMLAELCAFYNSSRERVIPFINESHVPYADVSDVFKLFRKRKNRSYAKVEELIEGLVRAKSPDGIGERFPDVKEVLDDWAEKGIDPKSVVL